MAEFHEMIKTLRERKNLTQKELADRLGISFQSLQHWESGRSKPSSKRFEEIATIFEISVDDLIKGRLPNDGEVVIGNIRSISTNFGQHIHALPLISIKSQATVIENYNLDGCQLHFIEDTYPVYLPEGVDKDKYAVIEIEGDSMEPEIRDRAKVLAVTVERSDFEYESGAVYAVLFANRFVMKRIKTNDLALNSQLILHSDNERYGTITVKAEDLRCMWKIVKIVDQPVR